MTHRFSAILDAKLHRALKLFAADEDRSMNSALKILLLDALATRGYVTSRNTKPASHDVGVDLDAIIDSLED